VPEIGQIGCENANEGILLRIKGVSARARLPRGWRCAQGLQLALRGGRRRRNAKRRFRNALCENAGLCSHKRPSRIPPVLAGGARASVRDLHVPR